MKPSTQNTMIVGILEKNSNYANHIVPLRNIHIRHTPQTVTLIIELPKELARVIHDSNPTNMILTVSDDPYMTWAGDWNHLGCSRFKFQISRVQRLMLSKYGLELECDVKHWSQNIVLAERFGPFKDPRPPNVCLDTPEPEMESYIFVGTLDDPILYLKTTQTRNLHASVLNLYRYPHLTNTYNLDTNMDVLTMEKHHFEGAFGLSGDFTMRLVEENK